MKKQIMFPIVILILLLIPYKAYAIEGRVIFILIDELEKKRIENLQSKNVNIGFVNLKTRPPYGENVLFHTINTGKKLSLKEFKKQTKSLIYLGDLVSTSSIGANKENIIIGNKDGRVDYQERQIVYDYNWLIQTTNKLLNKSDLLLVSFDIRGNDFRFDLLDKYISSYSKEQIIVLPRNIANEQSKILNDSLVPILYVNGDTEGLLTSDSTKREGIIVLEDISVQIKKVFGYRFNTDIGNEFRSIKDNNSIKNFESIYKEILSLLIIACINHGLIYLGQILILIFISKKNNTKNFSYFFYLFLSSNILSTLILGFFNFHRNILIYLIINFLLSIITTVFLVKDRKNRLKYLYFSIYSIILLGTIFYPKIIYNSYIGFNNLIYGARYYGLNNGIMGVLLITSILTFLNFRNSLFYLIFPLNLILLSTKFGSNTGGFITSLYLLGIIVYAYLIPKISKRKSIYLLVFGGILLFSINLLIDYSMAGKTHILELIFRIKEFGFEELTTISRYKIRELVKLSLLPPFSLIITVQILIVLKLKNLILDNRKREAIIVITTSLIGFLLNDTGFMTLIYIMHFYILHLITQDYTFE